MRAEYAVFAVCAIILSACTSVSKPYADLPQAEQLALVNQYKEACATAGNRGAALQSCVNKEIDKRDQQSLESYKQHRRNVRAFWYD